MSQDAAVHQFVAQDAVTENKWSKNGFGEPCPRRGGKFTREESELVRQAVEDYCAMKSITTARLCSECDHKAELKGAWMEIAKRLPHRTVQSVYRHGLRQLHPFKRGPWTESECRSLCDLVARMGKKWSAIQAKLNRSADSCRDKYREMSTDFVKGRWKEGETEILKRLIREHLGADPNADIKELGEMVQREGIVIPWSTISKRMSKRSRLSCFKKWQKMTGIFSPSDQKSAGQAPGPVSQPPASVSIPNAVATQPTAGAAAAAAAKIANPIEVMRDYDSYLLQLLASSGAASEEAVDWSSFRIGGDAQARWNALVDEWEGEPETLDLPLAEMAKVFLERKRQEGDAKMAAETVEAVDLPPVPVKRSDAPGSGTVTV